VVDELLWGLSEGDYYAVGYTTDILILIKGKFSQIIRGTCTSESSSAAV
jgi:hypothetical protein